MPSDMEARAREACHAYFSSDPQQNAEEVFVEIVEAAMRAEVVRALDRVAGDVCCACGGRTPPWKREPYLLLNGAGNYVHDPEPEGPYLGRNPKLCAASAIRHRLRALAAEYRADVGGEEKT